MVTDEMVEKAIDKAVASLIDEHPMGHWRGDQVKEVARRAIAEAALSAAEPVAWQPRYKQEVIDHHKSIGSDLWEYAMTVYPTKEQAQGYGYGGHECRALYAAPPAPSVAVKLDSIAHRVHALARMVGTSFFEDVEKDLRDLSAALSAQVQDVAGWQSKEVGTWKEQQAFEAWAQGERYEMHQHPLHYLFLDPKTNAARQGWKAALQFVLNRLAAAPAKQEGDK
ncbi:hypothetical protein [Agrobacterium sp. SUL3]|uniref:hypothetical protein n=1 Tax=Agrobacterium sp. SUL3 TaxID=1701910 RepID=UPI0006997C15|nr:hypothetical protein [Agrobacterium sp. SUL3]